MHGFAGNQGFRFIFPIFFLLFPTVVLAIEWPQQVEADEATIIVYQPQPESLDGNVLKGRAAMSLELKDKEQEPIFGAFWYEARIDTDRDAGTALIRDLKVTQVRWPDSRDAGEQKFTTVVENAIPESGFTISLARLTASLGSSEKEQKSLQDLKTDPPTILFADSLSVLLLFDGKPRFKAVENSHYERALNTPFVVVQDTKSKDCYLSSGTYWYQAKDPMGPWQNLSKPPKDLVELLPKPDADQITPPSPPAIVTADSPTELIVTQGKPSWQSLPGGELLYVENTETAWVRELSTSNMYVLLSGRWYRSKEQKGPWTFVRSDELPKSFKEIPPDSDIGGLRSSVAGTDEAEEAVQDAHIPQTAAIERDKAELKVEYDGDPKFEHISGTDVDYAVNTGAQVIRISKKYYAVDNGVWFVSDKATGPWKVADTIPKEEIDKIPPSSPVYNLTYVEIFNSTPEVVYVGYYPGYLWSFPYYGAPVYGTGWYYPPYWGNYYYPRPPTWGFSVGYNPWTGWNFGVTWSNGFFSFGIHWSGGYHGPYRPWGCCGGWYGGGYRGPVVINTGNINIGNNVNIGNRTHIQNKIGNHNNLNLKQMNTNLYQKDHNRVRNANRDQIQHNLRQAKPLQNRENNVFADHNGNVARQVGDAWENRYAGQWQKADTGLATLPDNAGERARDAVGNMSTEQRQAAQSSIQQRASSFQSSHSASHNTDFSGLQRSSQARQLGARREMARPAFQGRMGGGGGFRR